MVLPLNKLAQSGLGLPGVARYPSPGQGLSLTDRGRIPPSIEAFEVLSADRADPQDGEHWWRSDLNTLAVREGSTTYRLGEGNTIYRKVTEKDVVNTTTETDLLNGEITIAAGAMSTNKTAKVTLIGDYLNNSGGARTSIFRIKFGGTTIVAQDVLPAVGVHANRRPWRVEFDIVNLNAANVNFLEGNFWLGGVGTTATSGIGDGTVGDLIMFSYASNGTMSIDTASAQVVAVTWTHPTAHASLSMRLKSALVEVI